MILEEIQNVHLSVFRFILICEKRKGKKKEKVREGVFQELQICGTERNTLVDKKSFYEQSNASLWQARIVSS